MTDIMFTCPECQGDISVAKEYAGLVVPCPHCGKDLEIPSVSKTSEHHSEPVYCPLCGEQIKETAPKCNYCGVLVVGERGNGSNNSAPHTQSEEGYSSQKEAKPSNPGSVALGCVTIIVLVGLAAWLFIVATGNDVYVTKTGKTYHTYRNCMSLVRSKSVKTANDNICAIKGMKKCKICQQRWEKARHNTPVYDESDYEDDMMADEKERILSAIDCGGNTKFGPEQQSEFAKGGDAWCALGAGYNIELSRGGWIADIWDKDGKHYDGLGREYPFVFSREWRRTWTKESDDLAANKDAEQWGVDEQSVKWYRKAAEGDANAQNALGMVYAEGDLVPKDFVEAVKWIRMAAEQGHAEAQNNLGLMYFNGHGLPQDNAEAAKWYRKSAEQGYAEAQVNLGTMYASGVGVSKDDAEAVKWLRKAEAQGDAKAQEALKTLGVH